LKEKDLIIELENFEFFLCGLKGYIILFQCKFGEEWGLKKRERPWEKKLLQQIFSKTSFMNFFQQKHSKKGIQSFVFDKKSKKKSETKKKKL